MTYLPLFFLSASYGRTLHKLQIVTLPKETAQEVHAWLHAWAALQGIVLAGENVQRP